MAVHNADIAAAFEEIADPLELGDENPFRVRASTFDYLARYLCAPMR